MTFISSKESAAIEASGKVRQDLSSLFDEVFRGMETCFPPVVTLERTGGLTSTAFVFPWGVPSYEFDIPVLGGTGPPERLLEGGFKKEPDGREHGILRPKPPAEYQCFKK